MPLSTTKTERDLAHFLSENGVVFDHHGPKLRNPDTGRANQPDFFIPLRDLHIEVKGHMTLRAMKKVAQLANPVVRRPNRYYLYQATDYDWRYVLMEPAREVLGEREARRIHEHASRIAAPHADRSRQTKSGGVDVKAEREYSRAFQREEMLLMVKDEMSPRSRAS